jgi:hypothetical protein
MVEDRLPFDEMARAADPATSHLAAASVDLPAREQEVTLALKWLVCASDTHDIQRVLAEHSMLRDRNNIARRLTTLDRKGIVRAVGTKVGPHGRQTTLWMLTSALS